MVNRFRFSSTSAGVRKFIRWSLAVAIALVIIEFDNAWAESATLPPPIETAASEDLRSQKPRLILGVPLGPHTLDDSGIRVGFIDSGVDSDHPQLKGLVIAERDFTGEGPGDSQNHGTIVALNFIKAHFEGKQQLEDAAISLESKGLPPLVSAKVIGKISVPTQDTVNRMVEAIGWLADMRVKIVNISMALPDGAADYTVLCKEIEKHDEMKFFISAGNRGPGSVVYPAACRGGNKIVVGAVEQDGKVADYSGPADRVASGSVMLVSEAAYLRQEGDRLIQAGQFSHAEDVYKRALAANPVPTEIALIQYGLGYLALQQVQPDVALVHFQEAASAWPQYPESYIAMSQILTGKKHFEDSRRWLAKGVYMGADSARLRDRYARVLLDLDRPVEALAQLDALQKIDPSFENAGELRLSAQNMLNALHFLEQGTLPEDIVDAFLRAGDEPRLIGFVIRKSGLDPNTLIGANAIPLLVRAAAMNRLWSSIMLLELGARVDGTDAKLEVTALMLAAHKGNLELVKLLISNGAGLNRKDYLGFTPLMFAAEAGHKAIVKLLLKEGADRTMHSQEDKSALDYALKYGHTDSAGLLKDDVSSKKKNEKR